MKKLKKERTGEWTAGAGCSPGRPVPVSDVDSAGRIVVVVFPVIVVKMAGHDMIFHDAEHVSGPAAADTPLVK